MKVLITGAQFHNKGAQSLLFSLMSELYHRFSDVMIYYLPLDWQKEYGENIYRFTPVYDDEAYRDVQGGYKQLKRRVKQRILKKQSGIHAVKLHTLWDTIDVLFDVSGYQLTSKLNIAGNYRLLRYIETAKAHNVKVFLLPQSFGPFAYDEPGMDERIRSALKKADLIFAREQEGKNLLEEKYGISENVRLSPDLVLQSREDPCVIYQGAYAETYQEIKTKDNVGIIPNRQTVIHGNRDTVLHVYKTLIDALLDKNKNVYIFRHSDDLQLCRDIYAMYTEESKVYLVEEEMDCFAYCAFVKQFDFLIASRYHAVVHAYKQHVPVLILGWAEKYIELATLFDQLQFAFDITDTRNLEKLSAAAVYLAENYREESGKLRQTLEQFQTHNTCLEQCLELLKR